jgi:hypothetical protein
MAPNSRVHPRCRNATNPHHECSEYCFKVIAQTEDEEEKRVAHHGEGTSSQKHFAHRAGSDKSGSIEAELADNALETGHLTSARLYAEGRASLDV